MEKQLLSVIKTAKSERMVASQKTPGGMALLVYPEDDVMIVCVGYNPDMAHVVRSESVLQKRGRHIARYGAWLPSVFADGSWFLLRRIVGQARDDAMLGLSADDLKAAEELLS